MKTTIVFPKNKLLKKYIQYFLFIQNDSPRYKATQICYPNTNHCLGLHKGNWMDQVSKSEFRVKPTSDFSSYITGIYQEPIKIRTEGVIHEICINFEPFGLEMFMDRGISQQIFFSNVVETGLPKSWHQIYQHAFSSKNPLVCASNLERFFLEKLSEKQKSLPQISSINISKVNTVSELESLLNKNYRSIYRLFKHSFNISPKEFLNINRIRRAFPALFQTKKQASVAYHFGFSDQSHMIREFKRYTGHTPKNFKTQCSVLDNTLWWTIH